MVAKKFHSDCARKRIMRRYALPPPPLQFFILYSIERNRFPRILIRIMTRKSSSDALSTVWKLFSSVKLALLTLCMLSLASIIGTIIPQGESFAWYAEKFGDWQARFFAVSHLSDVFGSLWFKALLGVLSCNLIICTLDRFPFIWKKITADNLATTTARLTSLKRNSSWTSPLPGDEVAKRLAQQLLGAGWKTSSREIEDGILLFSQRGRWSRMGVFVVHASILIILAGAIIGSVFGFKGAALIPEGQSVAKIQQTGKASVIDLGFEVRCDGFRIEYYQNGMPKEYRSDLAVIEDGREVLRKSIVVNKPLTYKGVTFYQSSFEAYKDFIVTISDTDKGDRKTFTLPFQTQFDWQENGLRFGIINAKVSGDRINEIKIWITGPDNSPSIFWMNPEEEIPVTIQGKRYLLSAKQMYATGLQIAKDPGVWWVYAGCILILAGLFTTFFLSHRKIWVFICRKKQATSIYVAGSTNKNKAGFDRAFSVLVERLRTVL
jgi:cytochrome c biogenesis protein